MVKGDEYYPLILILLIIICADCSRICTYGKNERFAIPVLVRIAYHIYHGIYYRLHTITSNVQNLLNFL